LFDVIVAGGGTSGAAAAVSAAKCGLKVLVIEKNGFLGGTSTASLVTPMMKNLIDKETNLTEGLYLEVLSRLEQSGDSAVHSDGNPGWFNPEMMKCVLDDMCAENNVKVLFETVVTEVKTEKGKVVSIKCHSRSGFMEYKAKYYIDATGSAELSALAGADFSLGNNEELFNRLNDSIYENNLEGIDHSHQTFSLRFNMSGIDLDTFGSWIMEIDADSGVSSFEKNEKGQILLTTAHTWEGNNWKLRPFFLKAVEEGVLNQEDGAYFQIFSIPGQKGTLSFNCPRIFSEKTLHPLNAEDISYAYTEGRKQIRRIADFCRKYLPGFEEAFICQIAPELGIRDSRRIAGQYKLTKEDILNCKKFQYPCAKSNYPIDVHSKEEDKSRLEFLPEKDYYEIPMESLIPKNINNLIVVGKTVSAEFEAQASLRIQPNCWSMGEAAGKYLYEVINLEQII